MSEPKTQLGHYDPGLRVRQIFEKYRLKEFYKFEDLRNEVLKEVVAEFLRLRTEMEADRKANRRRVY